MSASIGRLQLKRHEDRRLRAGHLWVFSNEIDTGRTPLTGFEPGQWAELVSSSGQPLGRAYVNPRSLICARLMSRAGDRRPVADLLAERLRQALDWRDRCFDPPCYRWIYGESDGLPGLVVDRYDDVLVVQVTTAGMEAVLDILLEQMSDLVRARAVRVSGRRACGP